MIHFAYVLLRMLEQYSKSKSFMFVRKRKAARQKRKQLEAQGQTMPEEYGQEEDIEVENNTPTYSEHSFTFTSFESVSLALHGILALI